MDLGVSMDLIDIDIPRSPPSWTSLPSPSSPALQPVTEPLFEFPESHSKFLSVLYMVL